MLILIFLRLSPKCYFALDRDTNDFKRSSKGVQKRFKLSYDDYKKTLYTNESLDVKNVSIRIFRGEMSTVECTKRGLQNKFIKAFVEDDKVTVTPFDKFQ